jgi:phage terminase large subunit-like protein
MPRHILIGPTNEPAPLASHRGAPFAERLRLMADHDDQGQAGSSPPNRPLGAPTIIEASTSPFPDAIAAQVGPGDTRQLGIDEAITLGKTSPIVFGQIFLPRMFRMASPDFHYTIGELFASPYRFVAAKVFREGAKTSIARTTLAQRLCYGITHTGVFISASEHASTAGLRWLRRQIETNKRIQYVFGIRPGEKWTDTWLEAQIADGSFSTLVALGITGQVRGINFDDYRPDFILADDIQTEESVGTKEQRKKTSDLFFNSLANTLTAFTENPLAKMGLLQTPMEHGDIIDTVSRDPLWVCEEFGIFDDNGESRWPERFPTETLHLEKAAAIRRGGYSGWMREKEVKLVKSEFKTFDLDNVQYYDDLPSTRSDCVAAIDPASSDGKNADFQVILTAIRRGPDIFIARYSRKRGQMPDAACNELFEQIKTFNPRMVRVEAIGYQRVLGDYISKEMDKRRIYRPIDMKKNERRKKEDRIIQSLAGLVAHGHLHIHSSMTEILDEMRAFEPEGGNKEHDDILDALAMAVDALDSPFLDGMEIEGHFDRMANEDIRAYGKPLEFGGAP